MKQIGESETVSPEGDVTRISLVAIWQKLSDSPIPRPLSSSRRDEVFANCAATMYRIGLPEPLMANFLGRPSVRYGTNPSRIPWDDRPFDDVVAAYGRWAFSSK